MDPIARVFSEFKTIAIVGASDDPRRPSNQVAEYLMKHGFEIIPVNPNLSTLFGHKSFPDLLSYRGSVDVVGVFRNPAAVPGVVEQAIAKRAKVIWIQPGAENLEAAQRAMEAGLEVIMGVCMMEQHIALQNRVVHGPEASVVTS